MEFEGKPPNCFVYRDDSIVVTGLESNKNYDVHFPEPTDKIYTANSSVRVGINSSKSNFISDESVINLVEQDESGEETETSYHLGEASETGEINPSEKTYQTDLVSRKDKFGFGAKEKTDGTSGSGLTHTVIKPKYYTLGLKEVINYKGEKETVYAPVEIEWQDEWGWNWDDIDGSYGRVHNGEIVKDEVETPEEIEADEDAITLPYGIGGSAWVNGATMRLMKLGKASVDKSELGGKKFFYYEESLPRDNPEFSQEKIEQINQKEIEFSNYFIARCNNPGDVAIDGTRCGYRSAASRPGGL